MNFFTQLLFKIIDGFFSLVIALMSVTGPMGKELPKTPADFTPVLRFAVCSDVHLDGEAEQDNAKRYAEFFEDTYAYAQGSEKYKNVDAFVVAGDMTNGGRDHEYQRFVAINQEHLREGTQMIVVLGNHEFIAYRDEDASVGYTKFKEYLNQEVDTDNVINGFHIVGVSYDANGKTFSGKKEWLKKTLDAATKEDPKKPVFVIQHPAPTASIYGSINWSDVTTGLLYPSYPQLVTFSGHSHYAANDPRSINQMSFTAVGTGSLSASIVNIGYIEGDADAPGESGTFWIVEADAEGNIRLQLYDAVNHKFFEQNEYYLSDITNRKAHYCNWNNMKSLDTTPVFPKDAAVDAVIDEQGNLLLSFPNAECRWGTESYHVELSGAGKFSDIVISNYVRSGDNRMVVDAGKLPAGTYKYKIAPISPYAKQGKAISGEFTV